MKNIAVMVSGGGTNLQALIDGVEGGKIKDSRIVLVVSSKADAYALERAKNHGIPGFVADKITYPDMKARTAAIIQALENAQVDLIVLAGYMSILDGELIRRFSGKIINIHPSLIPKHCGKGFYGKRVHQSVLDSGDRETGATVHFVDEGVDTGPIVLQRTVPVMDGDTAETLAARVLRTEHEILIDAVNTII